ncbi:MAG TPA: hypothetical protein VFN74_21885, partial [Chloroflexota bacterium]|nr:hypothetical protein [Chloroflexota bacterium]
TAFLDPDHTYFQRFKTAFARWGALMPLLGQPFVLAGNALSRLAPERDAITVDGHTFRVEEWPTPGSSRALPLPEGGLQRADAVALISFLSNALDLPDGAAVGSFVLWNGDRQTTLPVRAGLETAEWAYDRPDVRGRPAHRRPRVAGHWIGQPRGNLYGAVLRLPSPQLVDRWELTGSQASWHVRAVAFRQDGVWRNAYTGERYWSERQTRDFFTRLLYSTLNAFTTAASAVLVCAIAGQLGFSGATPLLTALGYGVFTLAWPYAKLDFSEPAATLFTLLAAWALFRAFSPRAAAVPNARATFWLGTLAAGALFLSVVGKYTAALGAAALALQWALSSGWWRPAERRRALLFVATAALPALLLALGAVALMAVYAGETPVVFRNAWERVREDWLALPLWTGLRGLLFSPGKSLFLHAPWLLLAIPGGILLHRSLGRHATLFTLYPALTVVLYGMKLVWHGGGWGPRYLVPIVPFLSIASAPAVAWCLGRARGRAALCALAVVSLGVQLLGIAKDPETYPTMVREHVVRALPDLGSQLGGRDYWLARGGPGLARALVHPTERRRGLGYVWGFPTAQVDLRLADARSFDLSLYFVDWDRQARRQTVTVEDALGTRTWDLAQDFGAGVWATWNVTGAPERPVRIGLVQRGADTAVVSAAAFDAPRSERRDQPALDTTTRGDWVTRYGRDGYALFAWHSFNVDEARRPPYVAAIDASHVGDKPDPRIHVEIAEQDLLDTPLLYAAPFSPLLGNAWLLAADAARLIVPSRPDLAAAILARPPWTWAGLAALRIERPDFGLGLDFWPTLLYTNYASHRGVLIATWVALLALQATFLAAAARLLPRAGRTPYLAALVVSLLLFDWLQFQA